MRRAVDASLEGVSSDRQGAAATEVCGVDGVYKGKGKPWSARQDRAEGRDEAKEVFRVLFLGVGLSPPRPSVLLQLGHELFASVCSRRPEGWGHFFSLLCGVI